MSAASLALGALALSGCSGSGLATSAVPQTSQPASRTIGASASRTLSVPLGPTSIVASETGSTPQAPLCARPTDGAHAGCFASVRTDSLITSAFPDAVNGLTPNDLSSLYAYPAPAAQGNAGAGATVAVVVAYDYALAEWDLNVYRKFFGLPACTSASGCLVKVGAAAPPSGTAPATPASVSANPTLPVSLGWAAETDADIEMVSAVCPHCRIVIAEAASSSLVDLFAASAAAGKAGATIVNFSFGAPESPADAAFTTNLLQMNPKIVAASGDWGYGVYFPASFPTVIAVGGTSLHVNGTSVSETAWSSTGSGCSNVFPRQYWQTLVLFGCINRAVTDVSAVADPATGVAVYDSSLYGSYGGWSTFGGTSIAAPIISGMDALSGDSANGFGAQMLYAKAQNFLSVTVGSNGSCTQTYLCNAGPGYNGPTGLGVPHGLGGF